MSESIDIYKTGEVKKVYQNLFLKFGRSERALCCSKNKHTIRFNSLTDEINRRNLNSFSVLDYGCGLGDLYSYLNTKYPKEANYLGVDITPEFVISNKQTYLEANFELINGYLDIDKQFDFIVISGVFNLLYTENKEDHQNLVYETLRHLFEKTKIALSVDFMTDDVDYQQEGAFHQNAFELQKWVKTNLSKRYRMDFSYMPFEFSITIMKDAEIDKTRNVYEG